jgi:para-nitrobenzyl esterase
MQAFFANFVKTGNPNGPGVPQWPAANHGPIVQFMRLDLDSHAEPDKTRERYLFLDTLYVTPKKQP